jgi:hypothetical protein
MGARKVRDGTVGIHGVGEDRRWRVPTAHVTGEEGGDGR